MTATAAAIDLNAIDVPQLEGLVAQFYGAGTQEQVRARRRRRTIARAAQRSVVCAAAAYACMLLLVLLQQA